MKSEEDDENFYMKKRKFLESETLQMLEKKYKYVSNFKITGEQMMISNEYLLKISNMEEELKKQNYKLYLLNYQPYSARVPEIPSTRFDYMRDPEEESKMTPRVRGDLVSVMLSAKRMQSQS